MGTEQQLPNYSKFHFLILLDMHVQETCYPEESAITTADLETSIAGEKMISDNVAVNIAAGNATEPIH